MNLPDKVKRILRDQINSTLRLHDATGLPMLECRKMVLAAGGMDDLNECIANLTPEDL